MIRAPRQAFLARLGCCAFSRKSVSPPLASYVFLLPPVVVFFSGDLSDDGLPPIVPNWGRHQTFSLPPPLLLSLPPFPDSMHAFFFIDAADDDIPRCPGVCPLQRWSPGFPIGLSPRLNDEMSRTPKPRSRAEAFLSPGFRKSVPLPPSLSPSLPFCC